MSKKRHRGKDSTRISKTHKDHVKRRKQKRMGSASTLQKRSSRPYVDRTAYY